MHSSKGTCISVIRFFFTTNWFISVNFHYHLFSSGPVARTWWKLNLASPTMFYRSHTRIIMKIIENAF